MRPTTFPPALLSALRLARRAWPVGVTAAAGMALYAGLALLESALGTGLTASVLLEEGLKCALLAGFALLFQRVGGQGSGGGMGGGMRRGFRKGPGLPGSLLGLGWGLVAIAVFAAVENLAYFVAYPGRGILLRLTWSEPVHLVSGLAEATAIGLLALLPRQGKEGGKPLPVMKQGRVARHLAFFAFLSFALAWHLAFNLLADGPIPRLAATAGPAWRAALIGAALANLAAFLALAYNFAHRVIVGGFLYGQD